MFGWLGNMMSDALIFLNDLVNNYGLAIIIFTLIIKLVLYPMTVKQTRSMKAMQDLQPELKKIQQKYKDNKEKQQQEMMKLYKENNVNPAAGCLPMIHYRRRWEKQHFSGLVTGPGVLWLNLTLPWLLSTGWLWLDRPILLKSIPVLPEHRII